MKAKKILVIGGAGYIGAHMVKDLLHAGYEVVTLDDLSTGHREMLTGGTFVKGNLGDPELLDTSFQTIKLLLSCILQPFPWSVNPWRDPLNITETIWLQPPYF
jgi:nucleoside-diphosphate-sugar epimerase